MSRHELKMALLLLGAAMAGCAEYPEAADLKPLEFTYIRIGQDQYSTGGVNPAYEGSIAYTHCILNSNDREVVVEDGYEVYVAPGPPRSGLHLVKASESEPRSFRAGWSTLAVGQIHNVLVNETLENNSTEYVIHLWHQILNPEPVHRVDRWFNLTFTPYGPGDTTYSEGESSPCRA